MAEFKKIALSDGERLRKYLVSDNTLCCEFSFGNNILWNPDQKLEFEFINDVLIYRMIFDDEITYCTPDFKEHAKCVIEFIEQDAKTIGKPFSITCLNEEMTKQIEQALPGHYRFETNRDKCDYIYLTEKMMKLSGKDLHKKKNHLNKFLKSYEFTYETIDDSNKKDCLMMKSEWLESKVAAIEEQAKEDDSIDADEVKSTLYIDSKAINDALEHFDEFQFVGGLIRIDGKVVAFTIGERLSSNAFVTHFEKALDGYDGLYAAINQQFTEHELAEYTYVNREDDLGIPGLRRAKESYHPAILYDKYSAVKM